MIVNITSYHWLYY